MAVLIERLLELRQVPCDRNTNWGPQHVQVGQILLQDVHQGWLLYLWIILIKGKDLTFVEFLQICLRQNRLKSLTSFHLEELYLPNVDSKVLFQALVWVELETSQYNPLATLSQLMLRQVLIAMHDLHHEFAMMPQQLCFYLKLRNHSKYFLLDNATFSAKALQIYYLFESCKVVWSNALHHD